MQIKYLNNINSKGFTFLELIIVTAIVMVVLATVFLLQNFLLTQQTTTFQSFLDVENANAGVEQMVREIRNARYGDDGSYPLQICSDQNLTFFTNADNDDLSEKVQYYLDGGDLKKAVTKPSSYPINYNSSATITTIARGIVNGAEPIFSYYNNSFTGTGNSLNASLRQLQTRLIKITLVTNQTVNQDQGTDYTVTAFAQVRMLKDNL